jgi:hypothetical protein
MISQARVRLVFCLFANTLTLAHWFYPLFFFKVEFFFFSVLEFELRAYTLNHSTSPLLCDEYFQDKVSKLFAQVGVEP